MTIKLTTPNGMDKTILEPDTKFDPREAINYDTSSGLIEILSTCPLDTSTITTNVVRYGAICMIRLWGKLAKNVSAGTDYHMMILKNELTSVNNIGRIPMMNAAIHMMASGTNSQLTWCPLVAMNAGQVIQINFMYIGSLWKKS